MTVTHIKISVPSYSSSKFVIFVFSLKLSQTFDYQKYDNKLLSSYMLIFLYPFITFIVYKCLKFQF